MGPIDPQAPTADDDVEQILELIETLSAELSAEEAEEAEEATTHLMAGDDAVAHENRAIRRARGSVVRSRAGTLAGRVDEVRRAVEATRARRRRSPTGATGEAGPDEPTGPDAGAVVASAGRDEDARDALRATLADSARRLNSTRTESRSPQEMLAAIVAGAIRAIPHVRGSSVTLIDSSGAFSTHAPSDDLVAAVDLVQTDLREGPCIDALSDTGRGMIHAPDLQSSPPWPNFAARATEAGFHEVLSFQLVAAGSSGALNLYADGPHSFDAQDILVGALFADQAAVALAGARRVGELNKALETRDLIGRAKGILMERFALDDARAFEMLVESSQHTNLKLVAVAEWLVSQTEAAGTREPKPDLRL